jgi:hypothetical protein
MYKLGHRSSHKHKLYATLILLFAGLIIAGIWGANTYLKPDTTLGTSEGVIRHVDVVTPPTKEVSNSIFSMNIPKSWHATTSQLIPAPQYAWRGAGTEGSPRSLEIYVDAIPATMAVNRLLPLRANGSKVVVGDDLSDNCVNFTDAVQTDRRTGKILAKWSGVNFYCDAANSARNLVGTGTPEAINSVELRGPLAGKHRFFFIYTDHSAEPDYTIFTDMLKSFQVK